jgi:hypothetical protein
MPNMRFSIGFIRGFSLLLRRPQCWRKRGQFKSNMGFRIHTFPWLPSYSHDLHRRCHNTSLYVPCFLTPSPSLRNPSSLVSRLFILIARHPKHISHLPLLPILSPNLRSVASRSRRDHRDCEYSGPGADGSPGGLFWHLHQP